MIIGLTGTIGAGKGTVVEYLLQHHNFRHFSARDVITAELLKRNLELTRENMRIVSEGLRAEHGAGYFMEALLIRAQEYGGKSIIESIRTVGEVESLREKASNFYLFAVDADPKVRYDRVVKRNSSTDHVTFEKFKQDEADESFHTEKWFMNLPKCIALADYTFMNDGTVEEFFAQVEEVMKKLEV